MVRTDQSIRADSDGRGSGVASGADTDEAEQVTEQGSPTMTTTSVPRDLSVPDILISTASSDKKECAMKEAEREERGSRGSSGPGSPHGHGSPSTGRRRKNWLASIVHMKKDLDSTLKKARDKLSVVSKKQVTSTVSGGRRITLDASPSSRRRHRHPFPEDASFDQPNNNFSNSVVLMGLEDGMFCAELPLRDIPKGDLTIQVRNSKLIFIVTKTGEKLDSKHKMSQPFSCGYIELPIYIDPATIQVTISADYDDILEIRAYLKGTMTRSQSVSPPSHSRLAVSPCEVRKSKSCGASPLLGEHRGKTKLPEEDLEDDDYRIRINTR